MDPEVGPGLALQVSSKSEDSSQESSSEWRQASFKQVWNFGFDLTLWSQVESHKICDMIKIESNSWFSSPHLWMDPLLNIHLSMDSNLVSQKLKA